MASVSGVVGLERAEVSKLSFGDEEASIALLGELLGVLFFVCECCIT